MGLVRNVSRRHGFPQAVKLVQLLDQPLVLNRVEGRDGDNGVFYILHLSDIQGNRYVTLSGHTNIVPILENLQEGDLPATIQFEQRGNAFFMIDVDGLSGSVQEEFAVADDDPRYPSRASREAAARKGVKSAPATNKLARPAKPTFEDEDLPF